MVQMNELELTYREQHLRLIPADDFTFGRDPKCGLQLDAADRGISRHSGAFRFQDGTWWVVNLSRHRALHVVDEAGFATPLPVLTIDGEPSRRAVISPTMTVLVTGDVWTHALTVTSDHEAPKFETPLPDDPLSIMTQLPALTDNRKEAIVALVSGYLKPFPHYDPRPKHMRKQQRLRTSDPIKSANESRPCVGCSPNEGCQGSRATKHPAAWPNGYWQCGS